MTTNSRLPDLIPFQKLFPLLSSFGLRHGLLPTERDWGTDLILYALVID